MAARGPAVAWTAEAETLTYADLARRTQAVGAALRRRGLEPGDRVVFYTGDKTPMLLGHLGVMLAGGVSLPLNPRFTRDEMRYFLRDSGARFAVAAGEEAARLESLRPDAPDLREVLHPHELAAATEDDGVSPDIAADDPALILYSSGTTGAPKGAVHTHRNLAAALRALQICWQFTPDDTLLNALPLFHIHGLSFAAHLALLTGGRMILASRFHPRETLEQIARATVFYGIPPFYYAFLERPEEFRAAARKWSQVRLFTCGSAPIRPEVLPELEEILGQPVINRYGMTESHVITSLPLDGPARPGSVGLPLGGVEMRLRDEAGQSVPPGTVGEVVIRGPNLFTHYWQKPEATAAAFDADGWFATGDLGFVEEDGYLTLRGRKKDLIIVSGYNVYPPVVERVLNACPGVRESAVIGLPDPRKGERVVAVVVAGDPSLTEAQVKAHCAERLVDYQRPWKILFVDALPRNTMGKVLKRELREALRGGLEGF